MSVKAKFDQAEIELLKEGLKRTYKERFEMATCLFKIQQTMTKGVIINPISANNLWTYLMKKY